jgi:hypothetical protein
MSDNTQADKQIEKGKEDEENEEEDEEETYQNQQHQECEEDEEDEEDENNFNIPLIRNRASYSLHPPKHKHIGKKRLLDEQ